MSTTTIDVIVAGHLCLDLLPEMTGVGLTDLPSPGKLFDIGPLTMATGGAVSNTGLALHRLGVNVQLLATVGDDLLGRVVVALLKERDPQLADLIVTRPKQQTSYSVLLSPENVDRIVLHCSGANDTFDISSIDFDLVRQAKIFHLGYPPILPALLHDDGTGLVSIYEAVKAEGVITSLDMALPDPNGFSGSVNWPLILEKTLPYVDIFFPSIEEIVFMMRRTDYEAWDGNVQGNINRAYLRELADELLSMGTVITGFKLGELGAYLRTGKQGFERLRDLPINADNWVDQEHYHPTFEIEVAGTTGAGDAAYAGFLAALVQGLGPAPALRWVCAVGASNAEAIDATSGVKSWAETQARLDAGWPPHAARLPGFETT